MTFGGQGRWEALGALDQARASEMVARALDRGVNLMDTANVYGNGEAERMLGVALGARRKDVIVCTKVRFTMGKGPNERGLSRGHILAEVDSSLKRLGTDYIDLYQIHSADPLTPLDEVLRALEDLVRMGKVRYVGASNLRALELMKSLWIADVRRYSRFESLQAYYNVAARDLEREVIPILEDQSMGLLVWSPLAGGLLSGKYPKTGDAPPGTRRAKFDFPPVDRERAYRIMEVMQGIAKAHYVSMSRVALAWLCSKEVVTSVILGARRLEQLDDNLADTTLTAAELAELDRVSALPEEYPTWFLRMSADRSNA
jgi:aryl-alcohol dehydrogenase-like predicted oxidoreductase